MASSMARIVGVDPVGQELAELHVDEDPDLHRLERVALGLGAPQRRVDGDALDGLVADGATALVPLARLAALALEVGAGAGRDVRDGPVVLGDPARVGGLGEHAVDVLVLRHGRRP
jgi:hypothetical protein